ncbi:MAG: signal peptidase II [Rhodobacteraceae bacterium]|nr:signal peptidase II [Paracoccaceae bacterium]
MRLLTGTLAVTLLADQASKWAVIERMALPQRLYIEVFPPWLNFTMAWNTGINFGLFGGGPGATRWILIALALAICAWVLAWAWRERSNAMMQLAAGLLVGGALGNVIDRLRYGAVADFINMSCCGIHNPYAFNIADVAIFAGAGLLIVFAGRHKTP